MTHDELLAQPEKDFKLYSSNQKYGAVFRAVVELHRPEAQKHGQYEKCWNCSVIYPCPTIQAIEKELG